MEVEVELIKSLKLGEAPPAGWTPAVSVPWEGCDVARSYDYYKTQADVMRQTTMLQLRGTLATVKKELQARNWTTAEASSVPLLELAAEVARSSARDYPAVVGPGV